MVLLLPLLELIILLIGYFTINGKTFYTGYNSDYAAAHNISFPVVKNDVLVFNKTIIGSDGTNYIYFIPYK